jgi:protein TonB
MFNYQTRRFHLSGRKLLAVIALLTCTITLMPPANSQTPEESRSERKVVSRVEPEYPEALKRLFIGGVVRIEVVVAPNGAVEDAQVRGGNPILGQSALKAVKRWKYAPAPTKEKFVVKFQFDPHGN